MGPNISLTLILISTQMWTDKNLNPTTSGKLPTFLNPTYSMYLKTNQHLIAIEKRLNPDNSQQTEIRPEEDKKEQSRLQQIKLITSKNHLN